MMLTINQNKTFNQTRFPNISNEKYLPSFETQNSSIANNFWSTFETNKHSHNKIKTIKKTTNERMIIYYSLFLVYKTYRKINQIRKKKIIKKNPSLLNLIPSKTPVGNKTVRILTKWEIFTKLPKN